jgi:hypothetical protein
MDDNSSFSRRTREAMGDGSSFSRRTREAMGDATFIMVPWCHGITRKTVSTT